MKSSQKMATHFFRSFLFGLLCIAFVLASGKKINKQYSFFKGKFLLNSTICYNLVHSC